MRHLSLIGKSSWHQKFKHYSSQYLKTIASYYFKKKSNFNYLLSSQDTQLSATGKLSKQDKHANYRNIKPETKQKIYKKTLKHKN